MNPPPIALPLPDGRVLTYAEHGPSTGTPVLYFHGTPASKHNWYLNHDDGLLQHLGLRVIALDRPGIGGSSPQPARTLPDWADDVRVVADALGLRRFAVLGYSCGAPYAFACALRLADRVVGTTIVSGMVDITHPDLASFPPQQAHQVLRLAATRPWASRLVYWMMGAAARFVPGLMIGQAAGTMPPADQETIREAEVGREFVAMLRDTFAQGTAGAQHDSALVATAWGLDLAAIPGRVRLWHGDADRNVPLAMAQHLVNRIPGAELTVLPGEGHLSLVHRHVERILEDVAAEAGAPSGVAAG